MEPSWWRHWHKQSQVAGVGVLCVAGDSQNCMPQVQDTENEAGEEATARSQQALYLRPERTAYWFEEGNAEG